MMSAPRPAMLVATVTTPLWPASATMTAARRAAPWWPLLLGAVVVLVWLRLRRRRPRRIEPPDAIARAYEDLLGALAAAGHPPDPGEDAGRGACRGPRRMRRWARKRQWA